MGEKTKGSVRTTLEELMAWKLRILTEYYSNDIDPLFC